MSFNKDSGIPTRSVSLAGKGSVGVPRGKLVDSWQKKTATTSEETAPKPVLKPWQKSAPKAAGLGSIASKFGGAGNGGPSKFGPSKFGGSQSGSNTPPEPSTTSFKRTSPTDSKGASPFGSKAVSPSTSKTTSPFGSKTASPSASKTASPGTARRSIPVRNSPRSSPRSSPVTKRKSPKTSPKFGRKSPPKSPAKKSPKIPRAGGSRFGALKAKGFKGVLKEHGLLKQRIERVKEFIKKHNKISEIQKELLISAIDNESYTCRDLQLCIFAGSDLQAKFTLPGKDPNNPKVLHKSTKQFIQLAVSKLKFPQHVKDKLSQAIVDDNCEIGLSKVTILIKSGTTTQNITLNLPGVLYPQIIQRETNIATSSLIEIVDKFTVEQSMNADERNSVLSSIYNNNYSLDGRRLSVLVKDGDKRNSVDFDIDPAKLTEKESVPPGTSLPYFYVPEDVSDDDIKEIMIKTISSSTIDTESMELAIKAIKHGRYRREGSKILIEGFKRDSLTSSPELAIKIRKKKEEEPKPFSAVIEATTVIEQQGLNELESFKFNIGPLSNEMIQLKHKIIKVITMLSIEDRIKIELINKLIDDNFKIDGNIITIKSSTLTLFFMTTDYEITDVKISYNNKVQFCKYIPIRIVILGTDAIKQSKFNEEKKKLLVEKFYTGDYVEERGSVKIAIAYNRIPVRFSFGIPKPVATIPDVPKDELKVKVINDLSTSDLTKVEQDQVLQSLLDEDYTLVNTDVVFKIGVPVRSYRVRLIVDNSATSTPNAGSPAVGSPAVKVISKQDDVVLEEMGPSNFDQRPIDGAVREKLRAVIMMSDFDDETKTILLAQLEQLTYFTGDTVTIDSTKADGTPVRFTINAKFTHEVLFVDSGEGAHKNKKQKVVVAGVESEDVAMVDVEDSEIPDVQAFSSKPVEQAPESKKEDEPTGAKVPVTSEMRVYLIDSVKNSQFDQEIKDLLISELTELSYITGDAVELNITKSDGTPVKLTLNYSTSSEKCPQTAEKRVPSPEDTVSSKKAKLPENAPSSEKAPEQPLTLEEENVVMTEEVTMLDDEDIPMQEPENVSTRESAPNVSIKPEKIAPKQDAPQEPDRPVTHLDDVSVKRLKESSEGVPAAIPVTDEIRDQLLRSIDASNLDDETKQLLKEEILKLEVLDGDTIKLKTVKKDGTPIELTINVKNIVEAAQPPTINPDKKPEDDHKTSEVNTVPSLDEEDVPMPEESNATEVDASIPVQEPEKVAQNKSSPDAPTSVSSPEGEPTVSIPMTDEIRDQLIQSIRALNVDDETKDLLVDEINKLETLDGDTIKLKTTKKDGTPVELTINVKNIIEAAAPQQKPDTKQATPATASSKPTVMEEDVPMSDEEVSPQVDEDIPMQKEQKVKERESQPDSPKGTEEILPAPGTPKETGSEPSVSVPMTDDIRDQLTQSIRALDVDDETKALLVDEINKLESLDGDTIKLKTTKKDGTPVELTINVKNIIEAAAPQQKPDTKQATPAAASSKPTVMEEDVPMSDEEVSPQVDEDIPMQKEQKVKERESQPDSPKGTEEILPAPGTPKETGSEPSVSVPMTDDIRDQLTQSIRALDVDDETKDLLVDEINKLESLDGDTIKLKTTKKDGTPVELTINVKNIIEAAAPLQKPDKKQATPAAASSKPTVTEEDVPMSDEEVSPQFDEDVPMQEEEKVKERESQPDTPKGTEEILPASGTPKKADQPVAHLDDVSVTRKLASPGSEPSVSVPMTDDIRDRLIQSIEGSNLDDETKDLLKDEINKLDALDGDTIKLKTTKKDGTPVELTINVKNIIEAAAPQQKPDKTQAPPAAALSKPTATEEDVPMSDEEVSPQVDEDIPMQEEKKVKERETQPDFPKGTEKILPAPGTPKETGSEPSVSVPMTDDIRDQLTQSIRALDVDDETKDLLVDEINKLESLDGDTIKLKTTKKDGTPVELTINVKNIIEAAAPQNKPDKKQATPAAASSKPTVTEEDVPMSDEEVSPQVNEDIPMQEEEKVKERESQPDTPKGTEKILPASGTPKKADQPVAHLDDVSVTRKLASPGSEPSVSVPMTDDIRDQLIKSIEGSNLDDETKDLLKDKINKLDALDGDTIKLKTTKKDGTPVELTINVKNIIEAAAPQQKPDKKQATPAAASSKPTVTEEDVPMSDEEVSTQVDEDIPMQEENKVKERESQPDSAKGTEEILPAPGTPKETGSEPSVSVPMTDDIRDQLTQSIRALDVDDETKDLLVDEINKLESLDGDTIKLKTTKKDGTPVELTINVKNIIEAAAPQQKPDTKQATPAAALSKPTVMEEDVPMSDEEVSPQVDKDIPMQEEQKVKERESQPDAPKGTEKILPATGTPKKADQPVAHLDDVSVTRKLASPGSEPSVSVPMTDDIRDQLIQSIEGSNLDDETKDLLKDEINKLDALDGDTIKLITTKKDGTPVELTINVKNIVEAATPVPQKPVEDKPTSAPSETPSKPLRAVEKTTKSPQVVEEDVLMSEDEISPQVDEDNTPLQEENKVKERESQPDVPKKTEESPKKADQPVAHLDDVSVTRKLASPGSEPSVSVPMTDDIRDQLNQSIDGSNLDDETKDLLKDEINKLDTLDGDTIKLKTTKKDGTPVELTINVKNIVEASKPAVQKPTSVAPERPSKPSRGVDKVTKSPEVVEEDVPMSDEEVSPQVDKDIPMQEEQKVKERESQPDAPKGTEKILPATGTPKKADQPVAHLDDVSVTRKLTSPGSEPSVSVPMTDDIRDQLIQSIEGSNLDDETKDLLKDEINKLDALDGDTIKLKTTKKDGTPVELTINVKNIVEAATPVPQKPTVEQPTSAAPERPSKPSRAADKVTKSPEVVEEDVPMSDEEVSPQVDKDIPMQEENKVKERQSQPDAPKGTEKILPATGTPKEADQPVAHSANPTATEEDVPMSDEEVSPQVEEDIPMQEEQKVKERESQPDAPKGTEKILPATGTPKEADQPVAHLDDVSVTRKLASPGSKPVSIPMTDDIRDQLTQSIDASNLDDETKDLLKDEINKLEALDGDTIKLKTAKQDGTPIELTINVKNIIEACQPDPSTPSRAVEKPAESSLAEPVKVPSLEETDIPMSDEEIAPEVDEDIPKQVSQEVSKRESAPDVPKESSEPVTESEPSVRKEPEDVVLSKDAPDDIAHSPTHLDDVSVTRKIASPESKPEPIPMTDEMRDQLIQSIRASSLDDETKDLLEDEVNKLDTLDGETIKLSTAKKDGTPIELTINVKHIIEASQPPSKEPVEPMDTVPAISKSSEPVTKAVADPKSPQLEEEDVHMPVEEIAPQADEDIPMQEPQKVSERKSEPVLAKEPEDKPKVDQPKESPVSAPVSSPLKEDETEPEPIPDDEPAREITTSDEEGESHVLPAISAPKPIPTVVVEPCTPVGSQPKIPGVTVSEEESPEVTQLEDVTITEVQAAPSEENEPLPITDDLKEQLIKSVQASPLDEETVCLLEDEIKKLENLEGDTMTLSATKEDGTPVELTININQMIKPADEGSSDEDDGGSSSSSSSSDSSVESDKEDDVQHLGDVCLLVAPINQSSRRISTPMTDEIRAQLVEALKCGDLDSETVEIFTKEIEKLQEIEGDQVKLKSKKPDGSPVELTINVKNILRNNSSPDQIPVEPVKPVLVYPIKISQEITVEGAPETATDVTDEVKDKIKDSLPSCEIDDETIKLLSDGIDKLTQLKDDVVTINAVKKDGTPVELILNVKHVPKEVIPASSDEAAALPEHPKKVKVKPMKSIEVEPIILHEAVKVMSSSDIQKPVTPLTDDIKAQIVASLKEGNVDDEVIAMMVDELNKHKDLEGDSVTLKAKKKDGTPVELTINIKHVMKHLFPAVPSDGSDSVGDSGDDQDVSDVESVPEQIVVEPAKPTEVAPLKVQPLSSEDVEDITPTNDDSTPTNDAPVMNEEPDVADTESAPATAVPMTDDIKKQILDSLRGANLDDETLELLSDEIDKIPELDGEKMHLTAKKKDGTPIDLTINISHITKITSPVSSDDGFEMVEMPEEEPEVLEAPVISSEEKPVTESSPEVQPIEVKLSLQMEGSPEKDSDKPRILISEEVRSKIVDSLKKTGLDDEATELLVKEVAKLDTLEGDQVVVNTQKEDGTPIQLTINLSHLTRHIVPIPAGDDDGYELVEAADKPVNQSAPTITVEEIALTEEVPPEESGIEDINVEMDEAPEVEEMPEEPVEKKMIPVTIDIKAQIMDSLKGADLDDETLALLEKEVDKLDNLEGDQIKLDAKKKDGTPISLAINISHITRHIAPTPVSDEEGYELVEAAEVPRKALSVEEVPLMEEIPTDESGIEDISVEKDEPSEVEKLPEEPVQHKKVPVTEDIKSQILDSLKGADLDEETLDLLEKEVDKLDNLKGDQIKLDTKKKDGTPISLTINVSHITRHIAPTPDEEDESYELVAPDDVTPVEKEEPAKTKQEPVATPITDAIKAQIILSLQSGDFDDETMKILEEELEKIDSVDDGKMEIAATKKDGTPINLTVNINNIVKNIVPVPMDEEEGYELIESAPVSVQCDLKVALESPTDITDIPVTDDIKSQIADDLKSSGHDEETIDLLREQLGKLLNLNGDTVELSTYKKDGTPIDFTINIHRITKITVPVSLQEEPQKDSPDYKNVIPITLEIKAQIVDSLKSADLDEETLDLLEKEVEKLDNLEGHSIDLNIAKKDGTPISLTINLENITKNIAPTTLESEDAPELLESVDMDPCEDITVEQDIKEKVHRAPLALDIPVSLACIGKDIKAVPIGMDDYGYALEYPKAKKEEPLEPLGQFLAVHTEITDKIKEAIIALDIPKPAKEDLIKELDNGNMMACGANGLIKTTLEIIEPVATLVNLTLPDAPVNPGDIVVDFSQPKEDTAEIPLKEEVAPEEGGIEDIHVESEKVPEVLEEPGEKKMVPVTEGIKVQIMDSLKGANLDGETFDLLEKEVDKLENLEGDQIRLVTEKEDGTPIALTINVSHITKHIAPVPVSDEEGYELVEAAEEPKKETSVEDLPLVEVVVDVLDYCNIDEDYQQSTGLVVDVQMEVAAPKPKTFVLELTEQEWKDNQAMGAFAGMKISYTMEGEKYKIEMTAEQYEKYKKNCENPGYVLRLSEEEWQEHQANAMFAGLKISYTMDNGTYVVRLTDEQYEEYKKNSGGYSLCLTTEQYEELQKYNVFVGINITYTMQNGNYVIKMTNAEYQIYLKNRQIAGPITSMQYNITMAADGWYNVHLTPDLWNSMLENGKFCGLDVHYSVEEAGDYVVKLSQLQYKQFVTYRSKGEASSDVFSVTVDQSGKYVLGLAEDQYKTLVSIGSFKNLEIKVSVGSDRSHTVIMSKEDYNTFLTRHSGSGGSNEDAGKQFNISICPESGRYTLVLSAPQWAYLSKLEVLHQPGVQVEKQPDGSIIVYLTQEHYSIFLSSISVNSKPRVNVTITDITVEMDSGGQYILVLTSQQWITLRNQGAFAGLDLQVEELGNGDHKVILSAEEYQMFMTSQAQSNTSTTSLDFKVTITQENDYVIHLTVEQFEKMKQNGSFGELEVKWVHGPNREILVTLNTADYETLQSNIFQITAETEAVQRDNIQKRTFTRWANVQLKPSQVEVEDLYDDLKDGLKLIALLENLSKKPIKKTQRVKMNIHKLQNLEYALRHLEKEGVKLVNISNEDILSGNHKLTLGLIWTIICRYQFENLSMGNVTGGKLKSLLLAKCNQSIMIGYPPAKAHNFTSSFQDGMAFCAMIAAHAPDAIDIEACKEMEPINRHELAFTVAEERFDVHQLLEPYDTVHNPDEKSIMTYIAALTAKLPDLGVHVDVATIDDYATHARAVKQFLGDKKTSWDTDPLPVTVETIQAEIDALRAFGANQMPDKHKEIDLLAKAYKELEAKTDSDQLKIITDEALTPKDLSESFNIALNAKKGREQRLLNLLKKKENEGSDLEKISVDCGSVKEKLRQLAGEVSRGKETWPDASQPEIKRDCDRIDGFIDVITADLDNITKKYNEVAQYATDTDTITPIAVMIDEQNTEFEQIVEDYRAFISQHMKDSEDSLLNKIKDLSEKLDAKRTGLSNIQWTNDLAVLKSCLEDVEKIQNDINTLEADKNELKAKHESLVPSDPLYGKFDAVLARCIEKFDDTQKQAVRSHHDLSILRKFLEGVFQELPWIKKQEQNEIKRRWHIVVDPSAMPPCSQVEYQAELAKLTQHESSITQLIKVAKNLIKESPELDVLVQEPMFRLEVEWKRLYNLMQCCNTQLKIYEENLPFYRILNSITKNTNDINEALLHPNKEDPTKYKQLLEQHNKNIEIGLNQLEKLDKYPSTGYFIDRSILPSDVNGLGDVYLRGEKILRPGDTTQITRVGDNLVCEVKLDSGKKELLPIVYFTRPYEPPILKKFIIHHKQRVEEINVKVEALTKDLISQKIFEDMEDVLMWEDLPDELSEDEIGVIKAECEAAVKACQERGDQDTADALTLKLNLVIRHTADLAEKAKLSKDIGDEVDGIEEDIKVEMDWAHTTEKTIDDLLVKVPAKDPQEIEMNIRIYDEIASEFPGHEIKQKEIVVSWQNIKDKNLKLDKDLDPEISGMQDIMRNIKKKKNDLYDKTTIEFVDHKMIPLEVWVDVARKRVDQIDVDGDLPKLQKIIAEVNVFLEDMKEKEKDMDSLNSKWEEGVSLGLENPDIERRIAKLNCDWDELCDLTENKSNTANTALQNMEDYDTDWIDQKAALESVDIWIAEKQDVLKEFAEIPMDREKLDRMLGEHEMTIRDIEDRKPNIEAILEKGGLIVEALKHPETKKAASDKLNDLDKNYIDLEINCAAITRRLKDALGDMSDLDDKLKEVVRWEDESKDYIQKQEPVSEDPEKLKEQIANLGEFKEAVDEMRPEIDYVQNQGKTCLDKYGDKDSKMKELKMILANVNVNWEFIESWLKNRENELNAAKKRNNDKLFADIEAMIKWLGELKDLLNNNQVKSMININPIIDIIRKVQGELDEKKPQYLMLCEASAKEVPELEEPVCFELEAKTDKMKKLWNELCLDCEVQTRDIEDFVNKSAEVDESLDNLLNWANVKYGDLVKLEDVKPEELSKLLKPHEDEVNAKAPEVVGKLADVEQLLGPVADRDTDDLEVMALVQKHDALANKWQDIQDELEKLRKRANEYTDQESWFLDICLKMDKWLQIKKRILLAQPIVTMESFADDLKYHRDLLTEYEAKQIEFNRIWEISANIIKAVADPKKKAKLNLIRNKLANLWEEVYGLCMKRHYQFIEILKEVYRLEFKLVLTVEWLVETHYRIKHKPNGDFVQDIAFLKEIEANQRYVHQTFEDGRRVLRCVKAGQLPASEMPRKDTLPNIEKHLIDLHNNWERLLAEIVLEKQRIDQVMAPLETHVYRMDKLLAWLLAEQVKVEKDVQLGGTSNQLLRQLNAVKQLEVDLNNNRDRLKNLNEEGYKNLYNAGVTDDFLKTHGTCLARSCPQIDDNVTYIAAMNTTWKHLECHVRERKVRLEDLSDRMEKFDKLIQAQHHWLNTCSDKITKTQTDTGGAHDNEAIISELQTLHAQLLATNKIGLLLIYQHGEVVLPTIGKILDLQMHFDNTCSEAHSKHCHIDKSQLQLKLFRDSLEGMLAWLHKQRKAVDEKCRLVGSDGKLDELIEWHRKTKQDIETHRGVRDSILLISDRFIKELGHAEISQLKTSVSELKDGFSNLEISFKKFSGSIGV